MTIRKCLLAISLLIVIFFPFGSVAIGANGSTINLNVNGVKHEDQNIVIINQTTMVPIRTVSLLSNFTVDWDNQAKAVTVTNTATQETLIFILGKNEAFSGNTKLTFSTPPRNINGSIYVPLRFIGETLDAFVSWDAETKTAIIYNPSASDISAAESRDIVTARKAVLSLPKIILHEHISSTMDTRVETYYFPYGQTQKFFISAGESIRYYKVRNHAAWEVWEGQIINNTGKKEKEKDVIPGLVSSVNKEWGKRPTYSGSYSYFSHQWMAGVFKYGTVDENGRIEIGSLNDVFDANPIIFAIEGEKRKD